MRIQAIEHKHANVYLIGEVQDWEGHSTEALMKIRENMERAKQLGIEAINE